MSARQPFLPSRPASRALNPGDDASTTTSAVRAALPNPPPDANDNIEHGKSTRALNISSFKKSAPRTSSFGAAEFETAPRSAAKGAAAATRIYAPHPSTPTVLPGFPTNPEFKTPSLPFARSVEGPHTSPDAAAAAATTVPNLFRPKSCRPQQGEILGGRRPQSSTSSEQSFFGNAKFPFDSSGGTGDLDDSGYFSEHATDVQVVERFSSAKQNDTTSTTRFAKRGRPASPTGSNDEDMVVVMQSNNNRQPRDLPKRPCVRRASSPSRSRGGSLSSTRTPMLEESAPDASEGLGGAAAFVLPPHIPHPMAAMGEIPGLEFTELDLGRYAELYERGSERWSKAPMEEWVAGADDVLAKFGDMIDMIKDHMSSKMNLYKSLHTRLSDEHSGLEHRAKELRDASQSLVRDSGTIGGALVSHENDTRAHF